ncbi:MAG TPA: DUF1614 domain-containing protein [Dehalococcoidia bacterium]|nr:DUF1614 domain-containing protein [Dehalococcoidia bacterium]
MLNQLNQLIYGPAPSGFDAFLVAAIVVLASFIFFGAISSAFARLGMSATAAVAVVMISLVGSSIDIPLTRLSSAVPLVADRFVRFHGQIYRVPVHSVFSHDTIIAVNVGGALVPLAVCLYLALRFPRSIPYALIATIPVVFAVHHFAQLVPGFGVALPALLPPAFAALSALVVAMLAGGNLQHALVAAYVSGTLGTLIGADLLNLYRIGDLGAPVASIGGAGTFDGVFLAGVFAVLLVMIPWLIAGEDRPRRDDYVEHHRAVW